MSQPVLFERIESLFIFCAVVYFYYLNDFSFVWFIVLLFSIDIFMFGYLKNPRLGALLYNVGHIYMIPVVLIVSGIYLTIPWLLAGGLIWAAHNAWDRMFGYGLKFPTAFKETHLGYLGKK